MTDGKASNARRPRAPKVPQVRGWKCFNSFDVILHQIMSREAASCEAQPLSHVQQLVMDRLSSITTLKIRCKMCLSYVVVEKDSLWCLVPCWSMFISQSSAHFPFTLGVQLTSGQVRKQSERQVSCDFWAHLTVTFQYTEVTKQTEVTVN